jgi:hypothetical protein
VKPDLEVHRPYENDEDFEDYGEGGPSYGHHSDDYPFLYDHINNKLAIGHHGWYHLDMLNHTPGFEHMAGDYLGSVGKKDYGYGGRVKDSGEVDWYGRPPMGEGMDAVHKALGEHLTIPHVYDRSDGPESRTPTPSLDDEDWGEDE